MALMISIKPVVTLVNYSDVTWASCSFKSLGGRLFFIQQLVPVNHNRIIKGLHYWFFVRWLVDLYIYILVCLRFHKRDMCFHAVLEWVIVAEWRHMARYIWVSIGSGTSLLLDGTKPLSEPLFTYIQKSPVTVIRQILQSSISKMNTKISYLITYLNFLSNLPVTNELTWAA